MSRWTAENLKTVQNRLPQGRSAVRTAPPVDSTVAADPLMPSAPAGKRQRSKYGAVKTGGYASKREAKRAAELAFLAHACQISELEAQVRYELIPKQKGERPCHYIADFRYRDAEGALVVEDTKGYRTPEYRIKRKLMLWVYGIRVVEV